MPLPTIGKGERNIFAMKKLKKEKEKEVKNPYWVVKKGIIDKQVGAYQPKPLPKTKTELLQEEVLALLDSIPRDKSYAAVLLLLEKLDEATKKYFIELYNTLARKKWTDKFLKRMEYVLPLLHMARKRNAMLEQVAHWNPDTRNADKQVRSLINFLFVRYEMPEFLYDAWFKTDVKHVGWFIDLARGGSMRNLGNLPVEFSKRMAHEFMQAPAHMSVTEALRHAQVLGFGGDGYVAWYVNASLLGRNNFEHEEFWSKVIQFFAQVGMFNAEKLPEIMDYIQAQYRANRTYSMKGRTINALLRQTEEWHTELRQEAQERRRKANATSYFSWNSSGIMPFGYETGSTSNKNYVRISMRELLTSEALRAEGREQRHCVGSYDRACAQGETAIFTMRTKKQDALEPTIVTIQVSLKTKEIVQAKGLRNRRITPSELETISKWAYQNMLGIGKYL